MSDDQTGFDTIYLDTPLSREFTDFYAIYEEALPAGERKSRTVLESLVGSPHYRFIGLSDRARLVAFAMVFISDTARVALLEYMATDKAYRNKGLGARLFTLALQAAGARVLLVEADSEREHCDDQTLRARRKNFYLKQGCVPVTGLDYKMPQISSERPPLMDLLVHPNGLVIDFDAASIRQWLEIIYVEVYGRRPGDSAIAQMVAAYTDAAEA